MDAKTEDFPPTDPPLPDEYSDVESEDDPATERTKYQRGGRKQSTTNHIRQSRMPPVPETDITTEPNHRDEEAQMDEAERQLNGETHKTAMACPECAARKQTAEAKPPTPFETGIRAFNLKRASASGGRPVGVRATASDDKKSKKKSSKKKKKKAKVEVKESESEEESSSEEEEEEKPKPMSIKLDLDLVIEIFLKAKIQGEVTITFME
ncbi:hypothetical protein N431DRAFT_479838 [Stipitochalara longipes BDJ]|nr:hypothetical protein N431DRAFT_479838 [Stipitochalara longipes BDJ]